MCRRCSPVDDISDLKRSILVLVDSVVQNEIKKTLVALERGWVAAQRSKRYLRSGGNQVRVVAVRRPRLLGDELEQKAELEQKDLA
eukprot:7381789-Prymnesium_polylepis.2